MRVLVHGLVGTNLGGIETFLLNMNDYMTDDCIFDYVVEEESCMHEERIRKKGGRIYYVRSRASNPVGNTIDIIILYKKHRSEYKTIYYNVSSLSWILPEMIGRMMGFKVVVHSHNAMLIDANSGSLHRNMNKLNRWLLSHMNIKRLSCSKYASEFMFRNRESTIIYNGIDVEKYRFSVKTREIFRDRYGISSDTFVVGTVGRLAYQKNPLFTVDVFNEIQKEKPDSKLLMFGEGNLRGEIEEKVRDLGISEKVIMPGIVNNIHEVLNAMDVFLLPSRHEGLGIALIEAQANGLPCFTSKDVVPEEAKVTVLLNMVSLSADPKQWKEMINSYISTKQRGLFYQDLKKSNFNVELSARKLEMELEGKGF